MRINRRRAPEKFQRLQHCHTTVAAKVLCLTLVCYRSLHYTHCHGQRHRNTTNNHEVRRWHKVSFGLFSDSQFSRPLALPSPPLPISYPVIARKRMPSSSSYTYSVEWQNRFRAQYPRVPSHRESPSSVTAYMYVLSASKLWKLSILHTGEVLEKTKFNTNRTDTDRRFFLERNREFSDRKLTRTTRLVHNNYQTLSHREMYTLFFSSFDFITTSVPTVS